MQFGGPRGRVPLTDWRGVWHIARCGPLYWGKGEVAGKVVMTDTDICVVPVNHRIMVSCFMEQRTRTLWEGPRWKEVPGG